MAHSAPRLAPRGINADAETVIREQRRLQLTLKSGANWFFWIALLSLADTLLLARLVHWRPLFRLAAPRLVHLLLSRNGSISHIPAIAVELVAAAALAAIALAARRGITAAFFLGAFAYGVDTVLLLGAGEWLPVLFHLIALYAVLRGMRALWRLTQLRNAAAIPLPTTAA